VTSLKGVVVASARAAGVDLESDFAAFGILSGVAFSAPYIRARAVPGCQLTSQYVEC